MGREILASLTARGTKYDRMSAGTVRPENLAFLLTGLKRGPLLLAEWKDLGNERARTYLWAELHNVLRRMPDIKKWYEFHILDKLIQLSLLEIGSTGLCHICNGKKNIHINEKLITCKFCMGLGFRGMSGHDRAKAIGVPETSWRRHWRTKYADVYRVLLIYDQDITRNVRKRLKGG